MIRSALGSPGAGRVLRAASGRAIGARVWGGPRPLPTLECSRLHGWPFRWRLFYLYSKYGQQVSRNTARLILAGMIAPRVKP